MEMSLNRSPLSLFFRSMPTLVLTLIIILGWAGCLFDSKLPKPVKKMDQGQVVDSIYPANAIANRHVDLFWPILNPNLGQDKSSAAQTFPVVNIKEKYSGQVVRYRLTQQSFGSWNPELEFKWNYFLLQGNFIFQADLPDTLGMLGKTKNLYDSVHLADPFTNYFDSAAARSVFNSISTSTKAGAMGISVKVLPGTDTIAIQQVVAGSPADRVGIKSGMKILAVNDSSVVDDSALVRFRRFSVGDSGESVSLTLLGPQGLFPVTMIRLPVAFPTVQTDSLAEKVGYISINGFTPKTVGDKSTYTEFRDALLATKKFPMTVIDLRDNGGGSLDLALKMCDEILAAGTVIIRQIRRGFEESVHASLTSEIVTTATAGGVGEADLSGAKRKYLLLANENSASASEIMLVALNEGAGAPIMGTRSFGKGIGQSVLNTPGSGLALVTVLKFTSATGLDYHKQGIEPTFVDSSSSDSVLLHASQKAQELLGMPLAKSSNANLNRGQTDPRQSAQRAAAIEWNRRQAIKEWDGGRNRESESKTPSFLSEWP